MLGGTNYDYATGIAADAQGNAYVCGYTLSTNFPDTTTNVANLPPAFVHTNDFNNHYALVTNAFLTQITWNGSQAAIGYSSVFGGIGINAANGIAVDPDGNAYIVGSASCTNFPVTANNLDGFLSSTNHDLVNPHTDAFVIAFNTNAGSLLYSTYLGGKDDDSGYAIAVDPLGNVYVAGQTVSTNFPTLNAYQTARYGPSDMFIAKISQATNDPGLTIVPPAAMANPPGISLKWKMFPPAYDVEAAPAIDSAAWAVLPQSPVYTNGWYDLDVPATNAAQFFRLHKR